MQGSDAMHQMGRHVAGKDLESYVGLLRRNDTIFLYDDK